MLFLSKEDIKGLVSMEEAIDAVEAAFLKHAQGKTIYPPKSQFTLPEDSDKWWGFMPVYVEGMGVSCKLVCDYLGNRKKGLPTIRATLVYFDEETGAVKAIMDANDLTAIRTGALGGIASKYLSREDSETVGVIGCGVQARTQLEALTKVRKIKTAKIYDPSESSMDKFISDMKGLGIEIIKSDEHCVLDSDIVIAATASTNPVVFGEKIKAGTHVTSIGAHTPDARELDENLMSLAKVVMDCPDALKSGDLLEYGGELTEIKDVISGKKIRENDEEITVFKSVGTALQDVAMAALVYAKAKKAGIGSEIDF